MNEKRKAAAEIFMEQQSKESFDPAGTEESDSPEPMIEAAMGAPSPVSQTTRASSMPYPGAPYPEAARGLSTMSGKPSPKAKAVANPFASSEQLQMSKPPVETRETGFGFWRRVIVPPNAYVVHTRINRGEPVTLGMGQSFRYDPRKDSYLVIPAAMQTIGVVANCISREKQGINILAYVQWQISDFAAAYRKLDFSDRSDPLGIVNAQLREQAEAAIKDKIATMSVEEVLTDKAIIIEELTARLTQVTEGRPKAGGTERDGLGIKIVTVQIREALVSSETLWTDLQSPFRHEQRKAARVSQLAMENEINAKEMETRRLMEGNLTTTEFEIARLREQKRTEETEFTLREESVRLGLEQEAMRQAVKREEEEALLKMESAERRKRSESEAQKATELELARQEDAKLREEEALAAAATKRRLSEKMEAELHAASENARLAEGKANFETRLTALETELEKARATLELLRRKNQDELMYLAQSAQLKRDGERDRVALELERRKAEQGIEYRKLDAEVLRMIQDARNLRNDKDLMSMLIEKLPEIASSMPEVKEMRVFRTEGGTAGDPADSISGFVGKLLMAARALGFELPGMKQPSGPEPEKAAG